MNSIPCPAPDCYSGVLICTDIIHPTFTSLREHTCSLCSIKDVFVCVECREHARQKGGKQRSSYSSYFMFRTSESMRRHKYKYHGSVKKLRVDEPGHDATVFHSIAEDDDCLDELQVINYSFPNQSTQEFVDTCIRDGVLKAVVQMVVSSCYGCRSVLPELLECVDMEDIYLFLSIARLVTRVGSVNSSLLSTVLLIMGRNRDVSKLPIPLSISQLKSIVSNKTRRFSLINLLPLPHVQTMGLLHACVSLQECMSHSLAFADGGASINEKFQKIIECPKAQRIIKAGNGILLNNNQSYNVLLIFWFDGWDAASSLTKANKNPIWSGVITMIFVEGNSTLLTVKTRLMASGPGKADHYSVLKMLVNDYLIMRKEFSTTRYYCHLSQLWKILYPSLLFLWCDQPEKRSICGLLAGNSNMGPCFGISCNFQQLAKSIEACGSCRKLLTTYIKGPCVLSFSGTVCHQCWQWELPSNSLGMTYKYKEPLKSNFPYGVFPGYELNLEAGKVNTSLLKKGWKHAYDSFVAGMWTSSQVKDYLSILSMNDKTIQTMVERGNKMIMYGYAIGPPSVHLDENSREEIIDDYTLHPEEYGIPPYPPLWDMLELDDLLEVPMHMMGIVKAVSKLVHRWSQKVGCLPILVSHLNVMIHMHQRFCRIGRHPFATYSKDNTYPGWVSDTFRTWYKLMPWMYQCVSLPEFKFIPYQEPDTPWRLWNKKTCTSYCSARGVVGASSMLISELKHIIQTWEQSENGAPPCVIPFASTITGKDIREMIWYCHSTFKFWMSYGTSSSHNKAMAFAKLFLSKMNDIDTVLNRDDTVSSKPIYLAKYNLISLIRAMNQLKEYNSGRYVHEGGPEGEGIVKELRPLVPAGLKDRFAKNLIDSWNRDHELIRSSKVVIGSNGTVLQKGMFTLDSYLSSMNPYSEDPDNNITCSNMLDYPKVYQHKCCEAEKEKVDTETQEEEDVSVHSDVYDFCRYESYHVVNKYIQLGLPISVVFVKLTSGQVQMGCVVGKRGEWCLYPILPEKMQLVDEFGFTYFHLSYPKPTEISELILRDKKKEITIPIHNYAFLLPNLTMHGGAVEGTEKCSYAILTSELYHLDYLHNFSR